MLNYILLALTFCGFFYLIGWPLLRNYKCEKCGTNMIKDTEKNRIILICKNCGHQKDSGVSLGAGD